MSSHELDIKWDIHELDQFIVCHFNGIFTLTLLFESSFGNEMAKHELIE